MVMENFEAFNEQTNQAEQQNTEGEEIQTAGYENTLESDDDPLGAEDEIKQTNQIKENIQNQKSECYSVKYNGKDLSLTLDELKTNAQKGLNYDHIKGELESIKTSPMMSVLEKLSAQKQMTKEEFVMSLEENAFDARRESLVKMGLSRSEAEKIAKLEANEIRARIAKQKDKPYEEFAARFPDVKPEDIPNAVWQEFEKCGSLVGAYMDYENKRLTEKISMLEKNEENKQRLIGRTQSDAKASTDPFLEGLFG